MAVKIANAVRDENGGIAGGEVGDQDKLEVRVQKFYVKGWTHVFRPKNPAMAEAIAAFMEKAAANDRIGYSQSDRLGLARSLAANGGDVSKAEGDCDCSSLVCLACKTSDADVPDSLATGTMYAAFKKSGQFEIITDAAVLTSDAYAKRGDIYLRRGHTFVVLEDGAKAGTVTAGSKVVGQIVVDGVVSWCNVRSGPGQENRKIGKAYKNEVFDLYGVEEEWYKVDFHGTVGYIYFDLASEVLPGNV